MTRFRYVVFVLIGLLICQHCPAFAADGNEMVSDVTQIFKKQAESLLGPDGQIESFEQQLNEAGIIAYADRRAPAVGDVHIFNTMNLASNQPLRIRAALKKIGVHCYVFVEQGRSVKEDVLNRIVAHFDRKIHPEVNSMFGDEFSPGIDGDKRITLLLLDIKDSYDPANGRRGFTAGYFNAQDEFSRSKNPQSNQREMLYLDIYPGDPASTKFLSVIAHEFQHMVQWHHDPKEFDWVDESLSQLASFLCGYGHPPQVMSFVRSPHNNLCAWSPENTLANYGQVYLWAYYIATHISSTDERRRAFVRKMVEQKSQGLSGLNAAIKKQGIKNNVANLFRSFCLANYLNDSRIARGAYGYDKHLAKLRINPDLRVSGFPVRGKSSVKPWSARAVNIDAIGTMRGKEVQISFAGQNVAAGNYSNSFDVALVTFSSDRKALPSVNWLSVRKHAANSKVKIPSNHNRAFLLVVNRGSTVMKVEQAYARGARPAVFSFSIAIPGASRVASVNSSSSRTRSRVDSGRARRMIDEILASPFNEDFSGDILAQKDDNEKTVEEVELELAFQKIAATEDELIEQVRADVADGETALIDMFIEILNGLDEEKQLKLLPLKSRIVDILRFEQLQGNERASQLLSSLGA